MNQISVVLFMHSEVVHSEEKGSYRLIWKCNLPYKEIGVLWVLCKVSAKASDGKGGGGGLEGWEGGD